MSEQTMKSALGGTITITEQSGLPKFYELTGPDVQTENRHLVGFHTGNPDSGLTGWTIEDLLSISNDRLKKVNPSFPSKLNEFAMQLMNVAQMTLDIRYILTTAARKAADQALIVVTYNDLGTESMVRTVVCKLDELPPAEQYICIYANFIYHGKTPRELAANIATANYMSWTQGSNLVIDYMVTRAFLALLNAYHELPMDCAYNDVDLTNRTVNGDEMFKAVRNTHLLHTNWLTVYSRLTLDTNSHRMLPSWTDSDILSWLPILHKLVKERTVV